MEHKKRNQSFFGIHMDFHADPGSPKAKPVGSRTTADAIEAVIDAVKPDYLQCDCKGHPGWSSYPTRAGLAYPELVGDPLRVWRNTTARRGVALFMHYSGVIDVQACRRHPDWACMTAEGVTDNRATSTFGPYADELLIPQLCELAGEYGVDGMWVDGECWGTRPDYSPRTLNLFREKTGIDITLHPPVKANDPYYHEFMDFCREQFRIYLRHYVETLHRLHPEFQIASNWAFSSHMPEPVCAPVDFLSGDYSPNDSVNSARFEGRCLASQDKPWDLMAWGFGIDRENGEVFPKSAPQLMQEAAAVIMLGGGFQCYLTQRKDGSIRQNQVDELAPVARFCRERQSYCHQSSFVPQVALLYSAADHYIRSDYLFIPDKTDSLKGMTQLLCETQHSLEIRSEHTLTGVMNRWPLIAIPEVSHLNDAFRRELLDYAAGGGSLLLAGPGAVGLFAGHLGIDLTENDNSVTYISEDGAHWACMKTSVAAMTIPQGGVPIGWRSPEQDGDGEPVPAAVIMTYGKGRIACLPIDAGAAYKTRKAPAVRALIKAVTDTLYEPMVRIEGSSCVDAAVLEKEGKLLIQLVNMSGPHDSEKWRSIDEIPSVGPLSVSIKLASPPRMVTLQPKGLPVKGTWESGRYRFTVDKLDIHTIIAIDP